MIRRRRNDGDDFTPMDETTVDSRDADGCACNHSTAPLLSHCCTDAHEVLVISLSRFILNGYCGGGIESIDAALAVSVDVHGEDTGLALFTSVFAFVRALRSERQGMYRFFAAQCTKVTPDEQMLLACIQSGRLQEPTTMQDTLDAVAMGGSIRFLGPALRRLSGMIDLLASDSVSSIPSEYSTPTARRLH